MMRFSSSNHHATHLYVSFCGDGFRLSCQYCSNFGLSGLQYSFLSNCSVLDFVTGVPPEQHFPFLVLSSHNSWLQKAFHCLTRFIINAHCF